MTKAEIEALYDQIDGCLLSIACSGDHSLVGVADALSASKSALQALTDENERAAIVIDNANDAAFRYEMKITTLQDELQAAEARAIAAEEALEKARPFVEAIEEYEGKFHTLRWEQALATRKQIDAVLDAALAQKEGA